MTNTSVWGLKRLERSNINKFDHVIWNLPDKVHTVWYLDYRHVSFGENVKIFKFYKIELRNSLDRGQGEGESVSSMISDQKCEISDGEPVSEI